MWYAGGIGNNRNALVGVGQLTYTGFIFPKQQVMSTKNTPEVTTGYSNEKLIEFFEKTIDPEAMARTIRRINYILTLTVIRSDENKNTMNQDWLDDGFYFLNELAEILEPNLYID